MTSPFGHAYTVPPTLPTGSTNIDLTIIAGAPNDQGGYPSYQGHATTTYDGKTVTGPPAGLNSFSRCKNNGPVLEPKLKATAKSLGHGRYAIKVTSSIAGAGANETSVQTEPVWHALIIVSGRKVFTNHNGIAIVKTRQLSPLEQGGGERRRHPRSDLAVDRLANGAYGATSGELECSELTRCAACASSQSGRRVSTPALEGRGGLLAPRGGGSEVRPVRARGRRGAWRRRASRRGAAVDLGLLV